MKYIVKDEFIDQWFGNADPEEIDEVQANGIGIEKIKWFANECGVSIEDLMEQVEEV